MARALGGGAPAPGRQTVPLNPACALLRESRDVLLLQGPVGPFFDRLARWLERRATRVTRIVLQGGDRHDARAGHVVPYEGAPGEWASFLREFLRTRRPDCIVLFGQSRGYHQEALRLAAELGIPAVVLEEGYFRPGYVTMELGGVNSHSRTLETHAWAPTGGMPPGGLAPDDTRWHFAQTAWHAALHYAALRLHQGAFPLYEHHRDANPWRYARYWLRSWGVKLLRHGRDARCARSLQRGPAPYFFVPLQHDGDSQIRHHSGYARNAEFVLEVMHSFAEHAEPGTLLVFKQHPQSRGAAGHGALIRRVANELGIGERVRYLVEGDTRDLCRGARGVVVINSTVGLQALESGTPLVVMGEALYRLPSLTHGGTLHSFWRDGAPPDPEAAAAFLQQLKNLTQMPASIYAGRRQDLAWP
ncbi:capsular biosynthesis protein [Ramlibacter sp. USB13]|uniref:Capsular biosynthesis protein n=2 Tax=Ramlibacter cellulosilyticus TaxID=2764187 RepID=A0A923MUW4_9BURK|nr:capsular biosynthesis protein [Ramlibacter cellulosilyticus]